jgi:hypothetical protein
MVNFLNSVIPWPKEAGGFSRDVKTFKDKRAAPCGFIVAADPYSKAVKLAAGHVLTLSDATRCHQSGKPYAGQAGGPSPAGDNLSNLYTSEAAVEGMVTAGAFSSASGGVVTPCRSGRTARAAAPARQCRSSTPTRRAGRPR